MKRLTDICLILKKLRIKATPCEQFGMGALFHNISLVHHQDAVGILDGRESVGDDDGGSALQDLFHVIDDGPF